MTFGIHVSGQELLPKDKRAFILRKIKQVGDLRGEVSVLFVSDSEIKALNKKWRSKNKSTDVLSFPAEMDGILGDVVISVETASKQALEWGHDFSEEILVLFIHGLMHLMGYDHELGSAEAKKQLEAEIVLLEQIKINPQIALCGRSSV